VRRAAPYLKSSPIPCAQAGAAKYAAIAPNIDIGLVSSAFRADRELLAMPTKIYVGNLSPRVTQEEIRKLFEQHGEVDTVDLLTDRYSGESRGFGFVTMDNNGARAAITALDKTLVDGRNIKVNEAKPREAGGGYQQRGGGGKGGGWRGNY
jgi:cold-inducible RNA-binding protein